jgi:hypothetical protein
MRSFQVDYKTDEAVALTERIRVYSLDKAASARAMGYINASGKEIDTLFTDNFQFFQLLAMLVHEEPEEVFRPLERYQLQALGIEKPKTFGPNEETKVPLDKAGRSGGAIARVNACAPLTATYYPRSTTRHLETHTP